MKKKHSKNQLTNEIEKSFEKFCKQKHEIRWKKDF